MAHQVKIKPVLGGFYSTVPTELFTFSLLCSWSRVNMGCFWRFHCRHWSLVTCELLTYLLFVMEVDFSAGGVSVLKSVLWDVLSRANTILVFYSISFVLNNVISLTKSLLNCRLPHKTKLYGPFFIVLPFGLVWKIFW